MDNSVKDELRMLGCFCLACIAVVSLMAVPLPFNEVSYLTDPSLHVDIRRAIWFGIGGVLVSSILYFKMMTFKELGVLGVLMLLLLGPAFAAYFGLYWLSLKVFPK